jgi:protease-4
MQMQNVQIQQRRRPSLLRMIGIFLLAVFVIMFLLNYLLPAIGVGGCVGEINVDGEILTSSSYGSASSDVIVSFINEAELRPDVKGIFLEINSPGGSAVASKEIYDALKSAKKPTVAYIRETGASGGYYVALGADKIVSNPLAVTGSIGVRTTSYDLSSLLSNLGINTTIVKSGEMKDMGDIYRPMTDEEKALLQGIITEINDDFKGTVIEARTGKPRFSASSIQEISDARIMTGKHAYELGLVDELGSKQDAMVSFGEAVGLGDNPSVCAFRLQQGFLESMLSSVGRGLGESLSKNINTEAVRVEYR